MSELERYKKDHRIDGWPIQDMELGRVLSPTELMQRLNEYEAEIAKRDQRIAELEAALLDHLQLEGEVIERIEAILLANKEQDDDE